MSKGQHLDGQMCMLYVFILYVVCCSLLYVVFILYVCCSILYVVCTYLCCMLSIFVLYVVHTYSGMEEQPYQMPELKLINQIKSYCLSIVALVYCSLEKCMHVCDAASYYYILFVLDCYTTSFHFIIHKILSFTKQL